MKISKQQGIIRYIQFAFYLGAILDLLSLASWLLYAFADITIYLDVMSYPSSSFESASILYFGIGLMLGYTLILIWGAQKPLERIYILFNTSIVVIGLDLCFNFFILVLTVSNYTIQNFWDANWIRMIVMAILLSAWIIGKNLIKDNGNVGISSEKEKIPLQKLNQKSRLLFIKGCYWFGIIMDGLVFIIMTLYMWKIELPFPNLGFPANTSTMVIIMSLIAALMFGWTMLLMWGVQKPIERKDLLIITGLGVVLPFQFYDIGIVLKYGFELVPILQFFEFLIIRVILIIIMLGGYYLAKKRKNTI